MISLAFPRTLSLSQILLSARNATMASESINIVPSSYTTANQIPVFPFFLPTLYAHIATEIQAAFLAAAVFPASLPASFRNRIVLFWLYPESRRELGRLVFTMAALRRYILILVMLAILSCKTVPFALAPSTTLLRVRFAARFQLN